MQDMLNRPCNNAILHFVLHTWFFTLFSMNTGKLLDGCLFTGIGEQLPKRTGVLTLSKNGLVCPIH